MAKTRKTRSKVPPFGRRLLDYWWVRIKCNPITVGSSFIGLLVAVGALYSGWGNITGAVVATYDHILWATPVYARTYSHTEAETETRNLKIEVEAKFKKYDVAQAQVERNTYHIRRELADGKREQADDNLFKAQRDLKAANHALETETDPKNKQFIEGTVDDLTKQVNKLEATKKKIEQAIDMLEKEKPKPE